MKTICFSLLAVVATSTNAACYVTMPRPGFIVAWDMSISATTVVASSVFSGELSTQPVFGSATHDSQGSFGFVSLGPLIQYTAVGVLPQSSRGYGTGIAIPVLAGDRIYINTNQSGVSASFTAKVHVSF
jgi:hypothetical protein